MFVEMGVTVFETIRHLFQGHKQYIPVLSVVEGRFPGRVFVDNIRDPGIVVVWAIGRWAYVEAVTDRQDYGRSLLDLISHIIIPDSLKMKINWFELYARNSPGCVERLDGWLRDYNCIRHYESVYVWDETAYRQFRSHYSFPNDVVLKLDDIPVLPEHLYDTRFISDKFRSGTAIGCKAVANGKVVFLCRSNGFAAGDEFMIDVITFEGNYRGKGYATAAAVGLLDYCIEKGIVPLWETTKDNIASRRLACKLGFVENETYPVYAIEF